jgi:seryl-tRNA synthetase
LRFIKHGDENLGGKRVAPYSIPRFVVETKTLVQSDLNSSRARRFRLETAVIENTKNPKKSVFIPNDLQKGYGEGTYFQAIILTGSG